MELSFNLFHTAFENSVFSKLQNIAYLGLREGKIQVLSNKSFSFLFYLKSLNLRYNDISTLDSDVFSDLTDLTDMNLGHNKLATIGSDVFKLTLNLLRLSLDYNSLTFLPADVFRNLAHMQHLQLSNNLLSSAAKNIPSDRLRPLASNSFCSPKHIFDDHSRLPEIGTDSFQFPSTLKSLSLKHNKLSILRADVFSNLIKLHTLYLSHNFLNSLLEDVFTGLTSLVFLDLSDNLFTEFPYLPTLSKLTSLRLTNNKASSLYQKLFNELHVIKRLHLSHNRISIIPSGIFSNQTLLTINLAFNEITDIMNGSFPSGLVSLELNNNRLSTLPHDMVDLVKLFSLDLHNNRLVVLLDFSFSRQNLRSIRLSNNKLTVYPDSLSMGGRYLFLSNNKFVHFKNTAFKSNSIIYLDISGNKLYHLQKDLLVNCFKLRVLIAGHNKIRELPVGIFDSLQVVFMLSLKFNNLTMIHDTLFHSMRSLQHLYLEGNNLVTLSVNIFTFNIKLRHLTLSRNKLFAVYPETFESLTELEVLELEATHLKNVSYGCFDSLVNLESLLMSDNRIRYLFESMYNVTTKLQTLDLCCNNVSFLPMNIFTPLISLKYLNLAYNSLSQLPSLASCSKLISLELGNNMLSHPSFYSFQNLSNLKMLTMENNHISGIPRHALNRHKLLRVFVLNSNFITSLDTGVFKNLDSLQILRLSNNRISNIGDDSLIDLKNLITLELQHNNITYLRHGSFQNLTNMILLNISQNYIQTVYLGSMSFSSSQLVVDFRGNTLMLLTPRSFPNFQVTFIVDHYSACCFMTGNVTCISVNVRSDYLTCKRMLRSVMLRLTMWIVGLASVTFNVGVICSRLFVGMKNTLQSVLILNLAVSDFLMGIDMLILSAADFYYHNLFLSFSASWIESFICKVAATLSTLSSEASVILVALISLDRYLGIRYPLSVHRGLGKTRTRVCVFMCWLISVIISLIPVIIDQYNPEFYDISEVCVGLPIVKRKVSVEKDAFIPVKTFDFQPGYVYVTTNVSSSLYSIIAGRYWHLESVSTIQNIYYKISEVSGFKVASILSIIVFIGFNLACFIALAVFYIRIFQVASGSSRGIQSTAKIQEIRMAWKMSAVVLTDFLCWVPLALICLFVQCGAFSVGPEFYSWTVGLILPINSCLNPFLYTLAIILLDRQKQGKRTQHLPKNSISTFVKQ